jgi:ketosteroid isomerase-like protein
MKRILVISLLILVSAMLQPGQRGTINEKRFNTSVKASNGAVDATERTFSQNVYSRTHLLNGGNGIVMENAARQPKDESILLQMEREWNEALRTRNVAWFERSLAIDVTDISSGNGALHTKAQDIEALKADKTVYESLEFSDLKVRVEGNAGVVTGVNHIKGHDEQGHPFDVRLSFTDTYIKRDGRWQVWASQHTRVRP